MKEINVFEGWMNLLSEGTWALPDTPEKQQQLIALLADELPVGPDAANATELLYNLIGDDDLFDQLHALAQEDANADARTIVINKLEQMKSNPAVAQVIGKLKIESTPQATAPAETPPVTEETLCETCNEAVCECNTYESINESIERLAELSGTGMKRVFKNGEWVQPDVKEVSDTVEFGADGKPKAWSHDSDWKKIPRRDGKPVDPRGEVTNMAGRELQRAKQVANMKEDDDGGPVESAIINRIMRAHPELLQKFGPEAVMTAARDQAEWVGDVDEIGSSDISAYVAAVVKDLESSQINELSPDTLKSYIKKAGSSSHEHSASNLASRAADKLASAHAGAPGDDDGSWDDEKSYIRSKGIGRAVDRLEEISDQTVKNYKDKAWDEFARGNDRRGAGIGRALDKQRGAPGHVKTTGQDKQLDEGGMSEVDLTLQEIARGNVDIMDIYVNPKTNVEMFVQEQLHEKAQQVAREQNLDLEGDIDDILQRIQRELEAEYGTDDNMNIEMETAGGGNWLEETTALTGQYGHSGRLEAVKPQDADMMDRIKFLAGITK